MPAWIDRYQDGEHAEVWNEMQALGEDILKPAYRKAAREVVRETIDRSRRNIMWLFDGLTQLGYRFNSSVETFPPDYALELRLNGAMEYIRAKGGKKYVADPWSHPAMEFLDEEDIELPARYRNGKPGRANYRPPTSRTPESLDEMERTLGRPLSASVRSWFETIGSVDLAGTHPILNRTGKLATLQVVLDPVNAEFTSEEGAGAGLVATVRHGFKWAGFPGWSGQANPPERELEWLRSRLLPV